MTEDTGIQSEPKPTNVIADPDIKLKLRTQKMSIIEGIFGVSSSIVADNYFTPFMLAIGANPLQIGLMSSSTGFIAPVGQLISSHRMEKASRKGTIFLSLFSQLALWIPLILISITIINTLS